MKHLIRGLSKKTTVVSSLFLAGSLAAMPAQAAWEPTRSIEIIVPAGAGGVVGEQREELRRAGPLVQERTQPGLRFGNGHGLLLAEIETEVEGIVQIGTETDWESTMPCGSSISASSKPGDAANSVTQAGALSPM